MNLIERTVINLIQSHQGFYASLLAQMKRIETDQLSTCGVAVQNGRIYLYWNNSFMESLTDLERVAVLTHECLHLVFFHPFRRKNRNPKIFNWAGDIAINQYIKDLPACALLPETFGNLNLPLKEAAEVYYNLLKEHQDKYKIEQLENGDMEITRPDGSKIRIKMMDDHEKWAGDDKEDLDIDNIDAEVIKQAVKDAWEQSADERGTIPSNVSQAIKELLTPPVIPWQKVLRQYIGNHVKGDFKYTWKRLNRRFETEDFKGKSRTRILSLIAAVDTSGSISEYDLAEFISELKGIQASYKSDFTIIECDAAIAKVYKLTKYANVDPNFKGRGGTDFRPVFDYVKEHGLRPDVLIYFTDLYGAFPAKPPPHSTIWVQSGKGAVPVPFGQVIIIPPREEKNARRKR